MVGTRCAGSEFVGDRVVGVLANGGKERERWRSELDGRDAARPYPAEAATMKPRLAIELDDSSHQKVSRQERDAFVDEALAAAGLPCLHIPAARSYAPQELGTNICQKLSAKTGEQ